MLKKLVMAVIIMCASSQAYAWDGVKSGKLTRVDVVTNGENFGFRAFQDGSPMCGTSEDWGFVNKGDSNYEAMVAVLMSAYMNGKSVTLYSTKEGAYCHIDYAVLQ